jgi:hypothetical protein
MPADPDSTDALVESLLKVATQSENRPSPTQLRDFVALLFLTAPGAGTGDPEFRNKILAEFGIRVGLHETKNPQQAQAALDSYFIDNPPHPDLLKWFRANLRPEQGSASAGVSIPKLFFG